jgi:hypothetical protein
MLYAWRVCRSNGAVQVFERLIHADWSAHDKKKWMTTAERTPHGWQVAPPRLVPCGSEFLDCWLFSGHSVLAGFDFPIGVPATFGKKTGFSNFPEALDEFGSGEWSQFFCVADRLEDISLRRPFYPETYPQGRRQDHLLNALRVQSMDDLRRACERKTPGGRRAACSVFWTLGGNQVGKAAIDGWQSVIQPALHRGARLWPFHGRLDELSRLPGCVLCETYPQEAYSHVDVSLPRGRGRGKRNQEDRRKAGALLISWADERGVSLDGNTRKEVLDGFGPKKSGEDPFDAFVGLLGMINVADRRQDEGSTPTTDVIEWEGWILGQPSAL